MRALWREYVFTCAALTGSLFIFAPILASAAVPTFNSVQDKANQSNTAGNARQIITALRIYAGDNNGSYPDDKSGGEEPADSNDAFKKLIKGGVLDDERVFGAKASKYIPDNNIGEAPEYSEALTFEWVGRANDSDLLGKVVEVGSVWMFPSTALITRFC